MKHPRPSALRLRKLVPALAAGAAFVVSGCLGEPEIEDRWTRLDILEPTTGAVEPGTPFMVKGEVVYRSILTGAIVAEIRVSDTVSPADVNFDPEAPRTEVMAGVNTVLANSTSAGFSEVPFTGWDHLIQGVDLELTAPPAPAGDGGVFLLFYLADAEEEEDEQGNEFIVITPWDFEAREVLPMGMALNVAGAAAP